jgi:hypothetical protein
MYCPDCGTENANSLKFCTRCGTNLKAIESARAVVTEIGTPGSGNQLDKASLLRTIQWVSIIGLFLVTLGSIAMLAIEGVEHHGPPIALFFLLAGFTALVLIVRRLIKMLEISQHAPVRYETPMPMRGTTQQLPPMETMPYSVVEEKTRQFDN